MVSYQSFASAIEYHPYHIHYDKMNNLWTAKLASDSKAIGVYKIEIDSDGRLIKKLVNLTICGRVSCYNYNE